MDQNDDYAERDFPPLLEPENLVPLIVISAVAGILFAGFALAWGQ